MKTQFDIVKKEHGAGGYYFSLTTKKGNTRYGAAKKKAIINALQDSWVEGVYLTTTGKLIKQLLNGNAEAI